MKKQCKLWRGEVTIYQIRRTIISKQNTTTKSEEVSKYYGFDNVKQKYDLEFDWIESMYKHKFPKLFKNITQVNVKNTSIYMMHVQTLKRI